MFLTRLCVAATLDCMSSSASLLADGGKEVTLHYRFTIDSNWPLGTRVDICAYGRRPQRNTGPAG